MLKIHNQNFIKKMKQKLAKMAEQKTELLSTSSKTQGSTPTAERHFHSATTHPMSDTNVTEVNGISNATENISDSRMTPMPNIRELSHKKKDKEKSERKRNASDYWKFLSFDYQFNDWTQEDIDSITPLSSLTVPEQECALVEDLLFVLVVSAVNTNLMIHNELIE